MGSVSPDATVRVDGDPISTTLEGEEVILDPDSGTYYALNQVGTYIWSLLDGETQVSEIQSAVLQEYDAPEERVNRDVVEFVEELEREGFVRVDATENE